MTDDVWWYLTRAAGLMTWSTAVASVIVGVMLSVESVRERTGPWVAELHRFVGGLTVAFLLGHMITAWVNSSFELGVTELVVPGAASWQPEAIAWGVMAAWLLIAVEVTSILRDRISPMVWRVTHYASVLAIVAGTAHAVMVGSDTGGLAAWAIAVIGSVAIILLGAIRLGEIEVPTHFTSSSTSPSEADILLEVRERLAALDVPDAVAFEPIVEEQAPLPRRDAPAEPVNPFAEPDPTPWSFTAPATPPAPSGATDSAAPPSVWDSPPDLQSDPFAEPPAARPPAATPAGPPPLPTAIDPATGQPDEEAYRTWLVEWLAFAETYGDEAPDDPTRI